MHGAVKLIGALIVLNHFKLVFRILSVLWIQPTKFVSGHSESLNGCHLKKKLFSMMFGEHILI